MNLPEQSVEQSQVNLLIELLKLALHHDIALSISSLPDILEIVNALTPFVGQQRRGLTVTGLDPRREESSLVSLVPAMTTQC